VIAAKDDLTPDQFLHFVELDEFRDDWQKLGLDVEDDLLALQLRLMRDPAEGDLIVGTGGLRKLRFAPSGVRPASAVEYAFAIVGGQSIG
jgi:hypothetical protein